MLCHLANTERAREKKTIAPITFLLPPYRRKQATSPQPWCLLLPSLLSLHYSKQVTPIKFKLSLSHESLLLSSVPIKAVRKFAIYLLSFPKLQPRMITPPQQQIHQSEHQTTSSYFPHEHDRSNDLGGRFSSRDSAATREGGGHADPVLQDAGVWGGPARGRRR